MKKEIEIICEDEVILKAEAPDITDEKKMEALKEIARIIEERWLTND